MDDEVEVYENCFRYIRKTIEYSEPIIYIHKIEDQTIKTTQPVIKTGIVVKNPSESKVGNKIKLHKNDEDAYGLILFSSNRFKRFISTDGEIYYVTYIELIDLRTKIETRLDSRVDSNN
jgi:hypothetical protein